MDVIGGPRSPPSSDGGADLVRTPETEGVVVVHALAESSTGTAAAATRLRSGSRIEALRLTVLRHGRSRRHAELLALRKALEEAERHGWRRVTVISTDSRGAPGLRRLLAGGAAPSDPEASRIHVLRTFFEQVELSVVVDLDDPALLRTVRQALDQKLRDVASERGHRLREVEAILERAKTVSLRRTSRGFLANGRYAVTTDPPSCECPAWQRRWAQIPLAGRRASRLPCKHIAAAAVLEGAGTPADLERLVRRART